jgi:hypothetical protein
MTPEANMREMAWCRALVVVSLVASAAFGQAPATTATPAAGYTPVMTAKPAQARLSAADEARLNAMIAQHQKVRSQLPAEYQNELDQLTVQMRKQLFAALPRVDLLASAAQIMSKIIPGLTTPEATSLAEYALGGIATGGSDAIGAAVSDSGQADLMNATKSMQETQMSFNLQYLQLQSQMQNENRSFTAISNIMKTKHDTVKNSISNIR